jgi:methionyl-tRNA formyltransferase
MSNLRIAFAGDRDISVRVLQRIIKDNVLPVALLVADNGRASHSRELIGICSYLNPSYVLRGKEFRLPHGIELLSKLNLDFIIGIHFPYIVPEEVLTISRQGFLNLHPGYLPYNRGWHTPNWAILEGTPIGATLHFMDQGIDTGDIIHQKQLHISPGDTAHTLYSRLKDLEFEVFDEAWPLIISGSYKRIKQSLDEGASHKSKDLFSPNIQKIDLESQTTCRDLLRRLRALTTNRIEEAAFFEEEGRRFRVQVSIHEE